MLWSFEECTTKIIKQALCTSKTYKHNLLDERSVVDRHRCHMAAKFGVFLVRKIACCQRYTDYLTS